MRVFLATAALAVALVPIGCGHDEGDTPVACLEGAGPYLRALESAPGKVRLDGGTPISDCLAENQQAGDLGTVGTALVAAETKLNAAARTDPGGEANVELGYLIGAVQRGAESTQGIHAELVRRLTAAARYSPDNQPLPAVFLDAYQRGYDAGRAEG
jgi:hypothetical protein